MNIEICFSNLEKQRTHTQKQQNALSCLAFPGPPAGYRPASPSPPPHRGVVSAHAFCPPPHRTGTPAQPRHRQTRDTTSLDGATQPRDLIITGARAPARWALITARAFLLGSGSPSSPVS